MRIQHNITAMNSYRNFSNNTSKLNKNLEKLASGYKINRAGDDAAGLAISEKMRAQISGLEGATKNAKDGISLIQTAEGALTEVHDMLNRMVTLAEQSANGTYQDELDRDQLQKEITNLKDEIDRVADSTNYNGIQLLNGDLDYAKETTVVADSAISNITESAYTPNTKTSSFSIDSESVVVRPKAESNQTNTKFTVKLDAASFGEVDTTSGSTDEISLTIGNKTLTISADGVTNTAAGLATAFAAAGHMGAVKAVTGYGSGSEADVADSELEGALADEGDNTVGSDLAAWRDILSKEDGEDTGTAGQKYREYDSNSAAYSSYVEIEGHIYGMKVGTDTSTIEFTQVDKMDANSTPVNPNFPVSMSVATGDGTVTQQPQPQVTETVEGKSVGSSQQARANVNIDFSALKDGDKLVAGDKTYVFSVGKDSTVTDAGLESGEIRVDLTGIFKESSDLADSDKQEAAMVKMTDDMGKATHHYGSEAKSAAWTIGNAGVTGGIGTLTFQSLSSYDEDTSAAKIGGAANTEDVRMDSTSNITKQFYATSAEAAATTTFDLDVTKIKTGDTFNIDGKTFEFTDGGEVQGKGNVAVDLNSLGVSGGLLDGQKGDVIEVMKSAINGALKRTDATGTQQNKYSVTYEGNKVKLTSQDDSATLNTFENRVSANISTPSTTTYGKGLVLQIGDTSDDYNTMSVSVADMHAKALGIGDIDISTQDGASVALDKIKDAVNKVSDTRGNLGAMQNRLEHTINNLGVMRENVQNAESLIRDTDVAEEMMAYTKNNILNQSAQAMLAQANQLPQGVLQLLG